MTEPQAQPPLSRLEAMRAAQIKRIEHLQKKGEIEEPQAAVSQELVEQIQRIEDKLDLILAELSVASNDGNTDTGEPAASS